MSAKPVNSDQKPDAVWHYGFPSKLELLTAIIRKKSVSRREAEYMGVQWPLKKGWLSRLKNEMLADAANANQGRASDADELREREEVSIEFDGGTTCNVPSRGLGKGYGSYQINGGVIVRVEFGYGHSNNSGEVRTLIAALKEVEKTKEPDNVILNISGDSKIALNLARKGRKKKPTGTKNFVEAVNELKQLTAKFHKINCHWRGRIHSVKLFGH